MCKQFKRKKMFFTIVTKYEIPRKILVRMCKAYREKMVKFCLDI